MADASEYVLIGYHPETGELIEAVMQGTSKKSGALGRSYYYDNKKILNGTSADEMRAQNQVARRGPPIVYDSYRFFVSPKADYVYVYDRRSPTVEGALVKVAPTMKFPDEESAIAWMDWMLMLEIGE